VNYADDLVICCRVGANQAVAAMRTMISKLKLTVNENKTRVCCLPEEKFDFLGYTFGRCYSMRRGVSKAYRAVDIHARRRLRRWLCDKHNEPRPGYKRFPEASLHSVFGLVQLPHRTASLPWARAPSAPSRPSARVSTCKGTPHRLKAQEGSKIKGSATRNPSTKPGLKPLPH
jgi:hypothetical protein